MRRLLIAACAAGAGFVANAHAADTWTVREGQLGSINGLWQIERADHGWSGNARMALGNGAPLTYGVIGERKDGSIIFQRVQPSDGNQCFYRATRTDRDTMTGTMFCGGQTNMWQAQRVSNGAEDGRHDHRDRRDRDDRR